MKTRENPTIVFDEEIEQEWNEQFTHFFDEEKGNTSLCGSVEWRGGILTSRPTKTKCPICSALVNQP